MSKECFDADKGGEILGFIILILIILLVVAVALFLGLI